MGRMRTIKPEFFRSRSIARCTREARLTFQGLWCEADDHGRGIADARLLKGAIWPLDDDITIDDIEDHLEELRATGHIILYNAIPGVANATNSHPNATTESGSATFSATNATRNATAERYYAVVAWESHQSPAFRRGEAKYPLPPAKTPLHDEACKEMQAADKEMQESALLGTGNREQGTGKRVATATYEEDFEEMWGHYPRKVDKGKALRNYVTRRKGGVDREVLLAATQNYARSVVGKDPLYIKYPSTFFGRDEPYKDFISADEPVAYKEPQPLALQLIRHDDGSYWLPCFCDKDPDCSYCDGTGEKLDTPAPETPPQTVDLGSYA